MGKDVSQEEGEDRESVSGRGRAKHRSPGVCEIMAHFLGGCLVLGGRKSTRMRLEIGTFPHCSLWTTVGSLGGI